MKHAPSFRLLEPDIISTHNDFFHLIHAHTALDDTLLASIENFGIMQPLLVAETEGGGGIFNLLSGFKRLQAAITFNILLVPCLVLSRQTELGELYQYIAQHKHLDNNVSPIEDALLLQQTQQHLADHETLPLLQIMGYKPNKHQFNELLSLLQLEKTAMISIHKGKLTLKTGKKLNKLSQVDQHLLVSLIDKYHFGGSKQHNFVQMVIELSKRRQCSIEQVLSTCDQQNITDAKNIPQQGNQLLDFLQHQCSPELFKAEKAFQLRIHQLQLPEHFQLQHSASFEKDSCNLSITFDDIHALESKLDALKAMVPASPTRDSA
ncbi:ParB N-terminal domain-containing protein [Desulfogranum marinum]|uniref:ParB N-terminal domain-containing protein n=1 Tax=Desulfogranum marinum TaxID=453220 RepID=UPI0029C753A9|nr:ParB N-terminal domain-containing protein [Desulfogranum marinum]